MWAGHQRSAGQWLSGRSSGPSTSTSAARPRNGQPGAGPRGRPRRYTVRASAPGIQPGGRRSHPEPCRGADRPACVRDARRGPADLAVRTMLRSHGVERSYRGVIPPSLASLKQGPAASWIMDRPLLAFSAADDREAAVTSLVPRSVACGEVVRRPAQLCGCPIRVRLHDLPLRQYERLRAPHDDLCRDCRGHDRQTCS